MFRLSGCLILLLILCSVVPPARATPTPSIALIEWQPDGDAENGFRYGIQQAIPEARFFVYNAGGDMAVLEQLIQAASRRDHDLYYVSGTPATLKLMEKIPDRPLVFTMVQAPVKEQIIATWPASRNNLTGISNRVPVLNQLRALRRIVEFRRLGVLYNPGNPDSQRQLQELESLGKEMNYQLVRIPVTVADQALHLRLDSRPTLDAVYLTHDPLILRLGNPILEQVNQAGLPSLAADLTQVTQKNALLGLVPEEYRIGRLAALSGIDILGGIPPGQIPSRSLDFFMVVLNMRTAQRLQVQVPLSLLVIADTIVR